MAGAGCQFAEKMDLQQRIEDRVKLPVVVTRSGAIFVLDSTGRDAKVLSAGEARGESAINTSSLRKRKQGRNRRSSHYRLVVLTPQVTVEAALAAMQGLEPAGEKRRFIHITIDTGPGGFDWGRLQTYVSDLIPRKEKEARAEKSKDVMAVRIEGAISRPTEEQINWLARQGIIVRLVLGPALGYADDVKGGAGDVLKAMAEAGLRAPVLYYWTGEEREKVAETLRRALRLNKLSGIGILPYFMSARFERPGEISGEGLSKFSEVVEFLHRDRFLSEFLEEPVSEIEQRLGGSPEARCIRYAVTPGGELLPYRQFAFAARRTKKATMYGTCRGCVWRRICGGVDSSTKGFGVEHKIIANGWCEHRKRQIRQIAGECLEIREQLDKIKDKIMEGAAR